MTKTATAIAHPNIAFIKYWGNRDNALRLPANGSVSMNLDTLSTRTTVTVRDDLKENSLRINGQSADAAASERVFDRLREIAGFAGITEKERFSRGVEIVSENNFPMGAGIASSAAAFAALTLAAAGALGLELSEAELSRLARHGSGSACRSVPEGFCEWYMGTGDRDSYAVSIAPASHWELIDLIAVISGTHKKVGSSAGHQMADTSPFQAERVRTAGERVDVCRMAVVNKDFAALSEVSERDMIMMHSVMMTQQEPLFYWEGVSLEIMKAVRDWREEGLECFATLDAGPNVHVICTAAAAPAVRVRLEKIRGIREILSSGPGGKAELL